MNATIGQGFRDGRRPFADPAGTAMCATITQEFKEQGFCMVEDAFAGRDLDLLCGEAIDACLGRRGFISSNAPGECRTVEDVNENVIAVHFPHKISSLFREYVAHWAITSVLKEIIGPNVKCMQSMLFMKSRGMPGQAWHQDEAFIPTTDGSLVGAWIALDRATVDNGCLWVLPGSHKPGVLWEMRQHRDPRFDPSPETFGFPYPEDAAVPVEAECGGIIFFHGHLLHRSFPNVAPQGYRRSYVNHYMSAESPLQWSGGNAYKLRDDYRDIIMVAGTDPWAHLGLADLSVPFYRTREHVA